MRGSINLEKDSQSYSQANSLLKFYPEVAKEWHPTKNGNLKPSDVAKCSRKKVWWRCKKGHEWEAVINNRTKGKTGCPHCAKHRLTEKNILINVFPDIAKEWHPTKNKNLTPKEVAKSSNKKVWWMCEHGHEWEAIITSRTKNNGKGTGCPVCFRNRVKKGNSLLELFPSLAKEWHPTKNGTLTPGQVSFGSQKRVWWKCSSCGKDWKSVISNRTSNIKNRNKSGCPYCSGKIVCKENCLETVYPEIAKQWHPIKNGNLKPTDVTKSSGKKVWWICERGHEWEAVIANRTNGSGKCPYCSGRRLIFENSLAAVFPEIAKEWHPTKNGSLTPEHVFKSSAKTVWWLCEKGHEWQKSVNNRTKKNGKQMSSLQERKKRKKASEKDQCFICFLNYLNISFLMDVPIA